MAELLGRFILFTLILNGAKLLPCCRFFIFYFLPSQVKMKLQQRLQELEPLADLLKVSLMTEV